MTSLTRELAQMYARRLAMMSLGGVILATVTIGTAIYGALLVPWVVHNLSTTTTLRQDDTNTIQMLLAGIGFLIGLLLVFRPRIRLLIAGELFVTLLVVVLGLRAPNVRIDAHVLSALWLVAIPLMPAYRYLRSPVRRYDMLVTAPAPDLLEA